MAKLKLAFCTDGIYPHALGGMQKHSRLLLEQLDRFDDLDITVIHPHEKNVFNYPNIREVHIKGIDESKTYVLECYSYSKRVYEELIKLNPDVIYSQGLSVWYGVDKLKKRLIINPHGLEPYQAIGVKDKLVTLPVRQIFNYLFKQPSVIISLGGKLTGILRSRTNGKTQVTEIANAVNLPSQKNENRSSHSVVKVLFLARFAHNKGIDILFSAIKILEERGLIYQFDFTLGGKGPLFEKYKKQNTSPNVKLAGFIPDAEIPNLYNTHDVFVLPTLFEGMPTVVLEAMSYGLPVIVSDVGATRVLVNEENGRVISPGSVDELVDALLWFQSLPEEDRASLSRSSVLKVQNNFTWPVVADQYHNLFKKLASSV